MRAKHEPFFVMRVGRDLKSARYGYGVALQTAPTRGVRMHRGLHIHKIRKNPRAIMRKFTFVLTCILREASRDACLREEGPAGRFGRLQTLHFIPQSIT